MSWVSCPDKPLNIGLSSLCVQEKQTGIKKKADRVHLPRRGFRKKHEFQLDMYPLHDYIRERETMFVDVIVMLSKDCDHICG